MAELKCTCKEWLENIDLALVGPAQVAAIHGFNQYTGPLFRFCPWCGTELKTAPSGQEEEIELACSTDTDGHVALYWTVPEQEQPSTDVGTETDTSRTGTTRKEKE